jgi:hypothetical protein
MLMKKYLLITILMTLACVYTFGQDVQVIDDFTGNTSSGIGVAAPWVDFGAGASTITYEDNTLRSDYSWIHSDWFPRAVGYAFNDYQDFSQLSMMVIKYLVTDGSHDSIPVRFDLYGDGASPYNDTIRTQMETNGHPFLKNAAVNEWYTDSTDFHSDNRFYCTYWNGGIAPIRVDSTKMKGFEAFASFGDAAYNGVAGILFIDYIKMRKAGNTSIGKRIYGAENTFGLAVYPSAGNSTLNIIAERRLSTIRVIDLTGKTIFTRNNINDKRCQLNISTFNSGVYFVSAFDTEGNRVTKKVYIR